MIVTAAELTGLGMSNGSVISSLAFNLGAVEARTLQNYVVKISNTALSAFASTTFEPSGTVVRNAASYTPVSGWNTIAFDNNYTWNGTSNLLVEVNFSNNDGGGTGTNTAQFSTTSGATSLFYRVDNATAAAVDAAPTASFAAYTQRNNMRFTFSISTSITWAPVTGLYTDAGATAAYTGTPASSVYFSNSATQAYTVTATSGAGCSNTGSVTVTVTPAATANAGGNQSICGGNTYTITGATATNNAGVNWTTSGDGTFIGGATLTPTYTPGVADNIAGTVTLTLTATGNSPCANAVNNMTLTITNTGVLAGTPGGPQVCQTKVIGIGATFNDGSCNTIASVIPAGGSPVSGSITGCVKVESSIPTYNSKYYVARHYDIEPAINPGTSSANVTLYFSPLEMAAFNADAGAAATHYPLPVNPGDNTDSVRIEQYHGTGTDPTNYTGLLETWSTANGLTIIFSNGYWAITVPATSFSGFWLTAKPRPPLPVTVEYFRGTKNGGSHNLTWKVSCTNTPYATMTLERSADGRNFGGIYTITASATRCLQAFDYADVRPLNGINYYRLKMADADGKVTYSTIVALTTATKGFEVINITPNPVTEGRFKLNITSAEQMKMQVLITDIAGRVVATQSNTLIAGFNAIDVNVNGLAKGTYQVTGVTAEGRTKTMQFVKQ
jgi:Secretion system C-terminal sorting domain